MERFIEKMKTEAEVIKDLERKADSFNRACYEKKWELARSIYYEAIVLCANLQIDEKEELKLFGQTSKEHDVNGLFKLQNVMNCLLKADQGKPYYFDVEKSGFKIIK